MNNSVNVQSPSFGMSYKIGNLKKFTEYLNTQEPEVIKKLTEEMTLTAEKLKTTKHADATLLVDDQGRTIYHNINWRSPFFNEKGEVEQTFGSLKTEASITEVGEQTLAKEQEMKEAFATAEGQAKIIKELQNVE